MALVLPLVHQFLGDPWFDRHDFDHVVFDAPKFDEALALIRYHIVHRHKGLG